MFILAHPAKEHERTVPSCRLHRPVNKGAGCILVGDIKTNKSKKWKMAKVAGFEKLGLSFGQLSFSFYVNSMNTRMNILREEK
jgi:hypothetical protein